VHEVARQTAPGARVVYVDHDPVVLAHSRALLATDDGVIAVKSDFRDPAGVLGDPSLTRLIDFAEPVAVLFLSVLHFIGDDEKPGQIVAGFRDRLPAGGYLVISAITSENVDQEMATGSGTCTGPRARPAWPGPGSRLWNSSPAASWKSRVW
jgi:S-adenosyl methyltransferase